MIYPAKWVLWSLEIMENILQVGNTVPNYFFAVVGTSSLHRGKSFSPFRKHTNKNKKVLITRAKWQLSEVQLQVPEGSPRRSEASGSTNHFSRIMAQTDETLLVDCF